jgi:hypothetical protein
MGYKRDLFITFCIWFLSTLLIHYITNPVYTFSESFELSKAIFFVCFIITEYREKCRICDYNRAVFTDDFTKNHTFSLLNQ